MKKITILDIIIIILLTLIVTGGITKIIITNLKGGQKSLVIQQGKKKFFHYALGQNKKIKIQGEIGAVIIQIKANKFRVLESSCQNKSCVHQGWVGLANIPIVCLPNKVSAYIQITKTSSDEVEHDTLSR